MSNKVGNPKGTRDFGPGEMVKRSYIFITIEEVYKNFGFLPIETPAMENLSVLTGKYGEEGDRLLFRILNSGDYLKSAREKNDLQNDETKQITPNISEKGLRYDLTVPFARFVVQHRNDLSFPFRRYQVQPVWRADRPQKGRYREFYQCDADIIGSDSLNNEAELIKIIDSVFNKLDLKVQIYMNNRKILAGIAEVLGERDKIIDLTVALDKIEKIGKEKVIQELFEKGFRDNLIAKLDPVLDNNGNNSEKIMFLKDFLSSSEIGIKGIQELEELLVNLDAYSINSDLIFNLNLARGLDYYTGTIIEVKSKEVSIGSICGGGRYDDLTGVFGMPEMSGVGISFGAERIYDVMDKLEKYPDDVLKTTKVLFIPFDKDDYKYIVPIANDLRENNLSVEIYPDSHKMKKIMNYANSRNIPYVVIVGQNERESQRYTLKNMETGEQESLDFNGLKEALL